MDNIVLYLVATPIGNLGDLSQRCIDVLKSVDFIAAEDTRNTLKLLNYLNIKKPLISYFEHNKRERGLEILKLIEAGKIGALVCDAGMPAISDPGEDLVKLLYENGYNVSVVPGGCAFACALVLSGLSTSRFSFEGFLSTVKKNRLAHLEEIRDLPHTLIFYEGPSKLKKTLLDLKENLGDRQCAVVREITKKYEEVIRGTLSEVILHFENNAVLGEFVIVVEGAKEKSKKENFWDKLSVKDHVLYYQNTGLKKMDAIKKVASDRNVAKSEIYKLVQND